jgi:pyrroloquinoline-quinone synthase
VSESVWKRIEESRARHNVLEHPFYVKWSAGELSSEELARYSGQYRHATEALAKLTADTAELAPDSRRDEMDRHAAEEQEHIGLWDDFVEAAGGEIGAEPTPETAECVQTWTARRGYLSALARLYAIESGQPEISRIKREGLAEFP